MLAGGVDVWIYNHVGGVRTPIGGVGNVIEFGIEGVVAKNVVACRTAVAVAGGRAEMDWYWVSHVPIDTEDTVGQLRANITIPVGYGGRVLMPVSIDGLRLGSCTAAGMGIRKTIDVETNDGRSSQLGLGPGMYTVTGQYI